MQAERAVKRGRGRPLEFDRVEAVRVAVEKFWRHGYQAMSISDLSEAMSITRTSFYNSFKSLDAIYREALDEYRKTAPDKVLGTIKPGMPVGPTVAQMFRTMCRMRAKDPERRGCLLFNALGEIQELEPESKLYLDKALRTSKQTFEKLLTQAVEQEEIPPIEDIEVAAGALLAFLVGFNHISKIITSERELWAICREFLGRYGFVDKKARR